MTSEIYNVSGLLVGVRFLEYLQKEVEGSPARSSGNHEDYHSSSTEIPGISYSIYYEGTLRKTARYCHGKDEPKGRAPLRMSVEQIRGRSES